MPGPTEPPRGEERIRLLGFGVLGSRVLGFRVVVF